MKLDNKGFTVIELTLSFVLVMFLTLSLFALVNNYRVREEKESARKELLAYQNTLTDDIYKDTVERKVNHISNCKDSSGSIIKQCADIVFQDGTAKRLQVREEKVEAEEDGTHFTYSTFSIVYGGVKYENPEPKFATVVDDYILTMTTPENKLEYGVIYKLKIRIKYQDIDDEFVIEVITTGVK